MLGALPGALPGALAGTGPVVWADALFTAPAADTDCMCVTVPAEARGTATVPGTGPGLGLDTVPGGAAPGPDVATLVALGIGAPRADCTNVEAGALSPGGRPVPAMIWTFYLSHSSKQISLRLGSMQGTGFSRAQALGDRGPRGS